MFNLIETDLKPLENKQEHSWKNVKYLINQKVLMEVSARDLKKSDSAELK